MLLASWSHCCPPPQALLQPSHWPPKPPIHLPLTACALEGYLFSAAFGHLLGISAPMTSHPPFLLWHSSPPYCYPLSPSMSAPWGRGFLPASVPALFPGPGTRPGAGTLRTNACPRKQLEVGGLPTTPAAPTPSLPPPPLPHDNQRWSRSQLWKMTCFYCYVCSGFLAQ